MKVIDDFLKPDDTLGIANHLNNVEFPWYFNPYINYPEDSGEESTKHEFQFVHNLYILNRGIPDSSNNNYDNRFAMNVLKTFKNSGMGITSFIRVKAKLTTQTKKHYHPQYHEDLDVFTEAGLPYKSAIYYVNTNNGYTKFENGDKVGCVRNRLIIFDGKERYTSVSCTDEKRKVVINLNFN